MEAHGFEGDTDLGRWVRSIKSQDWTSELFDQRLRVRRPMRNEKDVMEMVKTEVPGVDLEDLAEMIEMMHVAMRCSEDRPKMSDVVLMLENIKASVSNGKPEHDQKESHPSETK
ncbi:hypothetical protein Salat_0899700 [Sesamum alatum]|uniref:Uncharacterized protein n=1 Tax=Sesamum alatum TaxID=300844 RepID=A0AAE2CR15_9LAMI|nr:hypothetical protein Salat_0899700 [Sesamum alatum]